jgi:dolichol-phosphate mannosyltransferase
VKRYAQDVLFIDDGSTDGTAEWLEKQPDLRLIRHGTNQGYGQSLIDAFDYAARHGFDWVITMDCDEQHEPERIPDFLREIETDQWDIISGSRYLKHFNGDSDAPGDRQMINAQITAMINDLFGWTLTDSFCGFKAHRVSVTRSLDLRETGYAFPLQLWPRVYAHGLRLVEIPVERIYKDASRAFGGTLNDPGSRLQHYLKVFRRELQSPIPQDDSAIACCCGW